jgi:antibiotic biosynthesis monooxygenase (ABM) superfamily enzyme
MGNPAEPLEACANSVDHIRPPGPPSVHVRALLTWIVIFPLVALGMTLSAPLVESWHPALRALTLTLVVVPTTVYFGVPRLLGAYSRVSQKLYARRVRRAAGIPRGRAQPHHVS